MAGHGDAGAAVQPPLVTPPAAGGAAAAGTATARLNPAQILLHAMMEAYVSVWMRAPDAVTDFDALAVATAAVLPEDTDPAARAATAADAERFFRTFISGRRQSGARRKAIDRDLCPTMT